MILLTGFEHQQEFHIKILSSVAAVMSVDDLTTAASQGNLQEVRSILDQGVHPDSRNKYGRTALQVIITLASS